MNDVGRQPPPGCPVSGQAAGQRLSATDAERLIVRRWAHPEAPPEQQALAALFDRAAAPPTDRELAGEVTAVAAFVLAKGERAVRPPRRRRWRTRAIAAGIAAASVMGLSGAAAADALPSPVQNLAHQTFGVPAPAPGPGKPSPAPGTGTDRDTDAGQRKAEPGGAAAPGQDEDKATPPGQAKKRDGVPPGQAEKATPPGQAASPAAPPGLAKKSDGSPPGQAKQAGGIPSGQAKKDDTLPSGQAEPGGSPPPGQARQSDDGPPGQAKQAGGIPPGQAKRHPTAPPSGPAQ